MMITNLCWFFHRVGGAERSHWFFMSCGANCIICIGAKAGHVTFSQRKISGVDLILRFAATQVWLDVYKVVCSNFVFQKSWGPYGQKKQTANNKAGVCCGWAVMSTMPMFIGLDLENPSLPQIH